ncbi:MAG: ABC transporter substrate-binding protein [Microthrixaceae bacterium]
MSQANRDRLFRGYGPLIGFSALFLAIAILVPSQTAEVNTGVGGNSGVGTLDSQSLAEDAGDLATADASDVPGAQVAGSSATSGSSGSAGTAGRTTDGRTVTGSKGGSAGSAGSAGSGPAKVGGCADRPLQVPHDPYSPPCIAFTGGNGGATGLGVTADTIKVSVRIQGFSNGMLDALSKVANAKIPNEPPQLIANTLNGLVDYFNNTFQMYGRKIELVNYNGKGDVLKEMTGGGQEAAESDALKVQQEIKAFADVSAVSPVYADALSRRQIINVGAPYVSREWLAQRRPYSWSQFTDCSTTVESVASYYVTKLGKRNADFAGPGLKGQPRRAAIIAPENSWYQECVNSGLKIIERAGLKAELNEKYRLDINQMSIQAGEKLAKLKNAKITTVICGCDPLFLTFLTAKAKEQNYNPEWVITGVALIDNDLIGSILEQGQWARSFGVSFSGAPQPEGQGLGYRAYKSVRKDEPSIGVELIYNQLELLAIGIQMAGPNLNPASFEAGMFRYPTRTGPSGTWGFKPGDYSTSDDAREVFWNRSAVSPQTRDPGTYQNPNGSARFPIGKWPGTPPRVSP